MDTYILAKDGYDADRCARCFRLDNKDWKWLTASKTVRLKNRSRFIVCANGRPTLFMRHMKTMADIGEAAGLDEVWVVTIKKIENRLEKHRERMNRS